MLIVVAIVSILVAISIPLFQGKLCKVRIATNTANVRAAKAAAISEYLTEGERGAVSYLYDVNQGTVKIVDKKNVDVSNTDEKGIYPFILVTINDESVKVEPTKECVNQCKVVKGNETPTIPDVDQGRGTTDYWGESSSGENQKPPQPPQPPIIIPRVL